MKSHGSDGWSVCGLLEAMLAQLGQPLIGHCAEAVGEMVAVAAIADHGKDVAQNGDGAFTPSLPW